MKARNIFCNQKKYLKWAVVLLTMSSALLMNKKVDAAENFDVNDLLSSGLQFNSEGLDSNEDNIVENDEITSRLLGPSALVEIVNNNTMIPGEYGFLMRYSNRVTSSASGNYTQNTGNGTNDGYYQFPAGAGNANKTNYVFLRNVGTHNGESIDVRINLLSNTRPIRIFNSSQSNQERARDNFLRVNATQSGTSGNPGIYQMSYEFFESDSGKAVSLAGMWNYRRVNSYKDLSFEPADFFKMYLRSDNNITFENDNGKYKFSSTSASTVDSNMGNAFTMLFNETKELRVTYVQRTYTASGGVKYDSEPVSAIEVPPLSIGAKDTNDQSRTLTYSLYQSVPQQPSDMPSAIPSKIVMKTKIDPLLTFKKAVVLDADGNELAIATSYDESTRELTVTTTGNQNNNQFYEIKIDTEVNWKDNPLADWHDYYQADGYLNIPLYGNSSVTYNSVGTRNYDATNNGRIARVNFYGIPQGDLTEKQKVFQNSDFSKVDVNKYITNLDTDLLTELDRPVTAEFDPAGYPDTSILGEQTANIILTSAMGVKRTVKVPVIVIRAGDLKVYPDLEETEESSEDNRIYNIGTSATTLSGSGKYKLLDGSGLEELSAPATVTLTLPKDDYRDEYKVTVQTDSTGKWSMPVDLLNKLDLKGTLSITDDNGATDTVEIVVSDDTKPTAEANPLVLNLKDAPLQASKKAEDYVKNVVDNQTIIPSKKFYYEFSTPGIIDTLDLTKVGGHTVKVKVYDDTHKNYVEVTSAINVIDDNVIEENGIMLSGKNFTMRLPDFASLTSDELLNKSILANSNAIAWNKTTGATIPVTVSDNGGLKEEVDNYNVRLKATDSTSGKSAEKQVVAEVLRGSIVFSETPADIDFGSREISSKSEIYKPTKDVSVSIEDSRGVTTNWELYLKVGTDLSLTTDTTQQIVGGMKFINDDGKPVEINKDSGLVHTKAGTTAVSNTSLSWDRTKNLGLMLDVDPGQVSGGTYQGELIWTLIDGPESAAP